MPLTSFDHANVRTANLDAMVTWYADILGLHAGFRPNFSFPGAWLYLGDLAVIHLVGTDAAPVAKEGDNLRLEHLAFRASDFPAFKAKLDAKGIPYSLNRLDEIETVQVNVHDPDGNHLHIDFPTGDA